MERRPNVRLRNTLGVGLGLSFLAVTAYLTLVDALGKQGAQTEGTGQQPAGNLRQLSPGELADAYTAAQAKFAADPLDATALIELSHIAEARGDNEAADRLRLMAGQMQPRSAPVQAQALTILLKRRDFDGVMARLDGLIRARPQQSDKLFAIAAEIATDPEGSAAVARMMSARPPWRQAFFSYVVANSPAGTPQRILAALHGAGTQADTQELAALIDHELRRGAIDSAYAVWLSSLSSTELKRVKRVYDGGFDGDVRSLRFDWTVKPSEGFSYRLFPRNTASMDRTLQIDFAGFRGPFAHVSQILRLRPGRYLLNGEVHTEGLEAPSGFAFRIHCLAQGSGSPATETAALPQASQWMDFEKSFVIPASGCPDQLLQLESVDQSDRAQSMRGQIALDNIAIDSVPELAP